MTLQFIKRVPTSRAFLTSTRNLGPSDRNCRCGCLWCDITGDECYHGREGSRDRPGQVGLMKSPVPASSTRGKTNVNQRGEGSNQEPGVNLPYVWKRSQRSFTVNCGDDRKVLGWGP